jgi:hypothetical protein
MLAAYADRSLPEGPARVPPPREVLATMLRLHEAPDLPLALALGRAFYAWIEAEGGELRVDAAIADLRDAVRSKNCASIDLHERRATEAMRAITARPTSDQRASFGHLAAAGHALCHDADAGP